jgi:hypothetical protein
LCSTNPKQKIKRHEIVLAEVHDLRTKNATLVTEVTELKKTVGALKRENLRLAGGGAKPSASASVSTIERSISGSAVKPRTTRTAASSHHLKDAQRVRVDKENRLDLNGSVAASTTLKTPATVTRRRVAPSTRPPAAAPTALNLTAQLANGGGACGERDISLMLDLDDDVDADDDEPMLAAAKPFDLTGDLANLSVIAPKADLSPLTDEEDDDDDDDDDAAEDPLHREQVGGVY